MKAPDSLRFVVPSGVSFRWSSLRRRACRACAFAQHVARRPASRFHVQTSCLERVRPVAVAVVAFAGVLAANRAAPPSRRRQEQQKPRARAEGKIKGRGTSPLENLVCTWGWRGTRQGATACRESAQCRSGIGQSVCFVRRAATVLDGAAL